MKDNEMTFEAKILYIGEDLVKLYCEKTKRPLSELERQVILIFMFGMANSMREKLYPHLTTLQTETAMTAVMVKLFDYQIEKAQMLISGFIAQLQSPEPNTIKYLIFYGFDAYAEWENNRKDQIADEIVYLLNLINSQ